MILYIICQDSSYTVALHMRELWGKFRPLIQGYRISGYILFTIGDIAIMGNVVTFDFDQLTLTCISTGGPATTVTWTRDSTTTVTEGTETVLDDPETAQYTHTLTVTTAAVYTCTVENNKPSSDSASITLGGILLYMDCI